MAYLPVKARSELVTPRKSAGGGVSETTRRFQATSSAFMRPARRPTRGSGEGAAVDMLASDGDGAGAVTLVSMAPLEEAHAVPNASGTTAASDRSRLVGREALVRWAIDGNAMRNSFWLAGRASGRECTAGKLRVKRAKTERTLRLNREGGLQRGGGWTARPHRSDAASGKACFGELRDQQLLHTIDFSDLIHVDVGGQPEAGSILAGTVRGEQVFHDGHCTAVVLDHGREEDAVEFRAASLI